MAGNLNNMADPTYVTNAVIDFSNLTNCLRTGLTNLNASDKNTYINPDERILLTRKTIIIPLKDQNGIETSFYFIHKEQEAKSVGGVLIPLANSSPFPLRYSIEEFEEDQARHILLLGKLCLSYGISYAHEVQDTQANNIKCDYFNMSKVILQNIPQEDNVLIEKFQKTLKSN